MITHISHEYLVINLPIKCHGLGPKVNSMSALILTYHFVCITLHKKVHDCAGCEEPRSKFGLIIDIIIISYKRIKYHI
jgi:hypothetical protein